MEIRFWQHYSLINITIFQNLANLLSGLSEGSTVLLSRKKTLLDIAASCCRCVLYSFPQDFRGRQPTVDALLRHNNLVTAA